MDKRLFNELLEDKDVLTQVLSKSIEQEKEFVKIIEEKDTQIHRLENSCSDYRSEISGLEKELESMTEEWAHFREEIERLFLEDHQQLVWDVGTNTLEVCDK